MSYILDALRRSQAERERERGQVPGLASAPVVAAPPPPASRRLSPGWTLALGLAGGAGLALVVWNWPLVPKAVPQPAAPAPPVPSAATAPPAPPPLPVVVTAPPAVPAPAPAAPVAASTSVAAAPAPAPARVPTLGELTAEQRRELPPMTIGGSIWSESAQSRFVIVNGQVVREGEAAAPGVVVERIAPKAVVMRFRELRFELAL